MTSLHEQILTQVELAALRTKAEFELGAGPDFRSNKLVASAFHAFSAHVYGFIKEIHEVEQETAKHLLEVRPTTHGDFADGAKFVQTVMRAAQESPSWGKMTDVQKECFHHVAQKMQRVVCGDPNFPDHWDDIAGYAKIAVREINRNK